MAKQAQARQSSTPRRSRLGLLRFWVQAGFLLAWLDPLMLRLHTFCGPVFHCYSCPLATFACPIGVLANFSALHVIPFLAIGTLLAIGALVGSFVCGWACPFGFLQDLLDRVPLPKLKLPAWMGITRYLVLVGLVLVVPYLFGEEKNPWFFCRLCPAGALEAAGPNMVKQAYAGEEIVWPTATKTAIFLGVIGVSLFVWRPWCTLLCPLGAIYGLCNRFSFFFLRFRKDRCVECASCRSLCRSGGQAVDRIDGMECVRCLECRNCRAVSVGTVLSVSDASDARRPRPALDISAVSESADPGMKGPSP